MKKNLSIILQGRPPYGHIRNNLKKITEYSFHLDIHVCLKKFGETSIELDKNIMKIPFILRFITG